MATGSAAVSRSALVAALTFLLAGCPTEPPPIITGPDGGNGNRDGGGGGSAWSTQTVDTGGMGLGISLAVADDGTASAAYFAMSATEDGPCTELGIDPPPSKLRWQMRYAYESGGAWATEDVAAPLFVGIPKGLMLRNAPDGTPTIVGQSGDPIAQIRYCGANDVGLYQRQGGAWSLVSTVVATGGQAAVGEPASDYGEVVGHWPAITWAGAGDALIVYKDVHAGSLQGDDFKRADLELARGWGSSWQHIAIDWGEGAGSYNSVIMDGQGRPVVVYHVPTDDLINSRHGIWAARSEDDGATWDRVWLHVGGTAERPTVARDPGDGSIVVTYYSGGDALPKLLRLTDETQFTDLGTGWTLETIGDTRYDEGYHPSVAFDGNGFMGVAYYRCTRITKTVGECDPNDDALIFAWYDGFGWTREIVDSGAQGLCGTYPSLGFDPSGRAVIAYQCVERIGETFEFQVKVAERRPL